VASAASVKAFFSQIDRLDLLINNAGLFIDKPLVSMSAEDFTKVVDVCLKGAFLCSQAAVKLMSRQREGHLIHIGSFSALSGPAGQTNYAAAKAGLIALSQSLAREYGARNVRSNCVLPGFLDTKMTRELLANESFRESLLAGHALGRLNTPEDAARFILFLDSLPNISGQVFQLDSRVRAWT
jgi:3-oxoacyl-[acyl-carrier protein] reductase